MKNKLDLSVADVDFLLSPRAIRERAQSIFDRTKRGEGLFQYHPEKFEPTVKFVLEEIKQRYPSLEIPFHSRWGHFLAGGINRKAAFLQNLREKDALERSRSLLDLVITSVLLDAGAGSDWRFHEASSQKDFARSEGLGVASFYLFLSGAMSSDSKNPFQADAVGLRALSLQQLEKGFQVRGDNPLVGTEGRLLLLNNLAEAVSNRSRFQEGRPGNILDYLIEKFGKRIPAQGILHAVLEGFGSIWPGRLEAQGINLGDVWFHPQLGAEGTVQSLVPFHKLSQWMTYSLIEPIMEAGLEVYGVEDLTGLAEYRNGGLMIDSGLISPRDVTALSKRWAPSSTFIVEWRALTIHLLDELGEGVRRALGKSKEEFPLAKVLEGGTWWAGRTLAAKRPGGGPPVQIESDGTVF